MTRVFKTATIKRTVSEWRLLSSYHLSDVKWPLLLFLLTSFFFGWQELIEKVMILKKAVERERRLFVDSGSPILAEKLRYRWWDFIDGFQSRDKTAMLVHKTIANYVLYNNRMKFPKYFFSVWLWAPTWRQWGQVKTTHLPLILKKRQDRASIVQKVKPKKISGSHLVGKDLKTQLCV